jgi:hypothetical protein
VPSWDSGSAWTSAAITFAQAGLCQETVVTTVCQNLHHSLKFRDSSRPRDAHRTPREACATTRAGAAQRIGTMRSPNRPPTTSASAAPRCTGSCASIARTALQNGSCGKADQRSRPPSSAPARDGEPPRGLSRAGRPRSEPPGHGGFLVDPGGSGAARRPRDGVRRTPPVSRAVAGAVRGERAAGRRRRRSPDSSWP